MTHADARQAASDRPAAILLDLDGTLLDTVAVWQGAYRSLASELGHTLPDDFWPAIAGRSMRDSLVVLGPSAAGHDPDELVGRLIDLAADRLPRCSNGEGWRWLPGARELLELLRTDEQAPAIALVTSAWRAFTIPLLAAALPEGHQAFDAVVCGDDDVRPKPAPDPYLRAAELLGAAAPDCLVIEDSPTGVAAAEAARMVVLAVPHAGPVDGAPGRMVRDDLVGLTVEHLVALYARLRSGLVH